MSVLLRSLLSATLVALAMGQTPPSTNPSSSDNLAVSYGSTQVTPDILLPLNVPTSVPTITHPSPSSSPSQTYQVLLIDLTIPSSVLNTSTLVPGIQTPLAPGISPLRTTRLHFWQTGLTFASNGTLINSTTPIAFYQPPSPPPDDIPHTYVFYLFESDAGFQPPPAGNPFSRELVNQGMNRMSFNVGHLAGEKGVGRLVGATYFRAQRSAGGASASAGATVGPSGTGTGGVATSTTMPFTGSGNRYSLGWGSMVLTTSAVVAALLWAA